MMLRNLFKSIKPNLFKQHGRILFSTNLKSSDKYKSILINNFRKKYIYSEPVDTKEKNDFEIEYEDAPEEMRVEFDLKEGEKLSFVKEGKAKILIKQHKINEKDENVVEEAFYNPAQVSKN